MLGGFDGTRTAAGAAVTEPVCVGEETAIRGELGRFGGSDERTDAGGG